MARITGFPFYRGKWKGIPLGAPPPRGSKMAWWFLSREASQLLEEKRREGMFGGMPGKAPYWHVQDVGDERVGIQGHKYIEKSVVEFEDTAFSIIESYFMT